MSQTACPWCGAPSPGGGAPCRTCGVVLPSRPARPSVQREDRDREDIEDRPRRRRRRPRADGSGFAVASLVLGIVSAVIFCCWPAGMVTSMAGLAMGAVGLKSRARRAAVAGLVLSSVGLTFAVGFAVLTAAGVIKQMGELPQPGKNGFVKEPD